MRRVREAVHARHYEQDERKVQEARDGDNDQHFVGRVAHADRSGVQDVRRRRRRRRQRPGRHRVVAVVGEHVMPTAVVRDHVGAVAAAGKTVRGAGPSVRR